MSNHSLPAAGKQTAIFIQERSFIEHEQNIICSKTLICMELFAGHVVSSWSMKGREEYIKLLLL